MSTQRPRGRPPRHTQQALLDLVVQEFIARGYDATTMDDLARVTGLTKSSLYHHVRGKEHLLRLAVDRAVDALFGVLDEPGSTGGTAAERLEHVVRRSVEVLIAELPCVTLLLRVRGNTETERWALQRRRDFDRRVAALVEAAAAAGDLRADVDPLLATRLLFGTVNSLTEWYRPGRTPAAEVAGAVVKVTLEGLRRPTGRTFVAGEQAAEGVHSA